MTLGTMAVDHEVRVDFDRLRRERLARAGEQVERRGLGALLCFDMDNIRYITSTHIGEWARDKMSRYCILPRGAEPVLFEVGSAAKVRNLRCPWLKGKVRTATAWVRGTVPPEARALELFMKGLKEVLGDHGVMDEPLGVDILDVPLLQALQKEGIKIADGQDAMLDARMIKTEDEIALIEVSTSMVDAVYDKIVQAIRPGVRESDLVALAYEFLFSQGADFVEAMNVVSGPRTNPHPHDFSDRIIRPGDLVFIDILNMYNGYRTCYYRTFMCGEPTAEQRAIYKRAYDWLYAGIEAVKPGATTADVASRWPTAQELGFRDEQEAMLLQYGHGIGLSHRERPLMSRAFSFEKPIPLEENMVLALETYAGAPDGSFGARIEEELVVTAAGLRVMTKFPCKELIGCGLI